jgi:predicted nucleotidyltransferase
MHLAAAEAFVERAKTQYEEDITELYVFGSTVRGEAEGLASDVDVLVVLTPDADADAVDEGLHRIAYDVMLEYGPVVELHVVASEQFERHRSENDPFFRQAVEEGTSYV